MQEEINITKQNFLKILEDIKKIFKNIYNLTDYTNYFDDENKCINLLQKLKIIKEIIKNSNILQDKLLNNFIYILINNEINFTNIVHYIIQEYDGSLDDLIYEINDIKNYVIDFFLNKKVEVSIKISDKNINSTINLELNVKKELHNYIEKIENYWEIKDYKNCTENCNILYDRFLNILDNKNNIKKELIEYLLGNYEEFNIEFFKNNFNSFYRKIGIIRTAFKQDFIVANKDNDEVINLRNEIKNNSKSLKIFTRLYIDYCMTLFNLLLITKQI